MRRIHVKQLGPGRVVLPEGDAHHLRDVLRLQKGTEVELFDDQGRTAAGVILELTARHVLVEAGEIVQPTEGAMRWVVASAVPKGNRADWMIEKLSEFGTARFIPLATARAVVLPEGSGKRDRWARIAAESAKQSRRVGVMEIGPLTPVGELLSGIRIPSWYFSTVEGARPLRQAMAELDSSAGELTMFIGPEGGWTDGELELFERAGLTAVSLGETILRVETAALAAAAIAAALLR